MIPFRKFLWFLALLSAARAAPEFTTTRGWLHANGYTHHFNAPGANDNLSGAGFTWYARRYGRIVAAWEGDLFRDSGKKLCAYAGQSWTVPLRYGSVGVTGAVMYHRNFVTQTRTRILPVAFPFLESRGERFKLRLYYIPPVRSRHDQQVSLQLLLPLWR